MLELVLEPVNGSPRVVYRAIVGHPVPYSMTIQRNGITCTRREIGKLFKARGPVYDWLQGLLPPTMSWVWKSLVGVGPAYLYYEEIV